MRAIGPGGIDALRHARYVADQTSMTLRVTGLTACSDRLPEWAAELIAEFDIVADLESAPTDLASADHGRIENHAPLEVISKARDE